MRNSPKVGKTGSRKVGEKLAGRGAFEKKKQGVRSQE